MVQVNESIINRRGFLIEMKKAVQDSSLDAYASVESVHAYGRLTDQFYKHYGHFSSL